MTKVLVITGPTATGKSALAAHVALRHKGTVLNADSMQMYQGISLIASSPCLSGGDAPHELYGVWDPCFYGSVLKWGQLLREKIDHCIQEGRTPIICGGTGLYLDFLLNGYHYVPEVSSSVMEALKEDLSSHGIEVLYRRLQEIDPEGALSIKPQDKQRIIRRLSVFYETGRSLSSWHKDKKMTLFPDLTCFVLLVSPSRDVIYSRCDARVDDMMARGALDEISQLKEVCSDMKSPAWGALGAKSLASHLRGEKTLEESVEEFKTLTRRYAKRQMTWFRHQLHADEVLPYAILQVDEEENKNYFKKIGNFLFP